MNKIYNYLMLAAAFLTMSTISGCDAEKDLRIVESDEEALYDQVYILGQCANQFDSNNAVAMEKTSDPNVFTYRATMNYNEENKQFKFCTELGNWDKVHYIVPESGVIEEKSYAFATFGESNPNYARICSELTGDLADHFWGIREGEDGTYDITINVKEMTVTVVKVEGSGSGGPELYMQGVAGNSGCDSNNPGVKLDYDESAKRFYWEGELNYTESEGNRQFNFITSKGNWDQVTFLVPEAGDSDSYREMVKDGGVYKMKRLKGPGNPLSASWGILEADNGKYRIEVDVENLTLYVFKL